MESYIVAGFRTGVGKAKKGGFRFTRPDDLAADVIKHLVKSVPGSPMTLFGVAKLTRLKRLNASPRRSMRMPSVTRKVRALEPGS